MLSLARMLALDRQRIDAIVTAVCERLEGDWLLVGGAIAALWFSPRRTTEDVDIVGIRGAPEERYALMELADSLGLPVEAVNSAADFFVHRVADWREQIVLFRSGAKGRVYRPTATLFLLLKVRRLDERDLEDCRALVASGEVIERSRVVATIDELGRSDNASLTMRREELRRLLSAR
jgi:hypothetical protein